MLKNFFKENDFIRISRRMEIPTWKKWVFKIAGVLAGFLFAAIVVSFISPGSLGITPLWFYRTHCAWFWTPAEPKNLNMEELIICNWSLIQGNFPIKAIGGLWNNMAPAERNIALIEYLIKSGLRFLLG